MARFLIKDWRLQLRYFSYLFLIICFIVFLSGCSSVLQEYWSENYALSVNGAKASQAEIVDGKLNTFGVTKYPEREYDIILPEEKEINRIVIYSGNLKSYDLLCWDSKTEKWVSVGSLGGKVGRQQAYSDQYKMTVPRFDHRLKFKTNRIKLVVIRTNNDGVVTTRTPAKNEKVINQRTEYIQMGRDRVRVDLYDVFVFSNAIVREIELYSHAQKTKTK